MARPHSFSEGAHFLSGVFKCFWINTSVLFAHCFLFLAWGNCLSFCSISLFLLCVRRRGPPKNHHNNRRSGSRLAVQFHCAPWLYPSHASFLFPSACWWTLYIPLISSLHLLICAFGLFTLFWFVLLRSNWCEEAMNEPFQCCVFIHAHIFHNWSVLCWKYHGSYIETV